MFVVLGFVLGETRYGSQIYAIGGSRVAAKRVGIRTTRVRASVYVLSGVAAALGGLIVASANGSASPQAGTGDELLIISAVIIGGTALVGGRGNLVGTFLGVMFLRRAAERDGPRRAPGLLADLHRGRRADHRGHDRRAVPSPEAARGMTARRGPRTARGEVILRGVGLRKKLRHDHRGRRRRRRDPRGRDHRRRRRQRRGQVDAHEDALRRRPAGRRRDLHRRRAGRPRARRSPPASAGSRRCSRTSRSPRTGTSSRNLFLGRETVHGGVWRPLGVLDRRAMRADAREQLAALEVNVPRLTGVPIAHALGRPAPGRRGRPRAPSGPSGRC